MTYTVTITSQGQISIPAKVRRELGFKKSGKSILSVKNGKVTIEPVKDLLDLKGSIKTKKKILNGEKIHDLFAKTVADKYGKKPK